MRSPYPPVEHDELFPHLTTLIHRRWDFDRPEDFDWVSSGVGTVWPISDAANHAGQARFDLSATDAEGFTAYAPPACIYLGRGTSCRLKWHLNLSAVKYAHFAFGLTAPEGGWLGASSFLENGIVLRTDSGDNRLDFCCASNNASSSYPSETADTQTEVRMIGEGQALWSMHIVTDRDQLGKGVAHLFVNGLLYHSQELLRIPYGVALAPAFGIFNGAAASRYLAIDAVELEYGRFTTTSPTAPLTGSTGGDNGLGSGGNGGGGGQECIAEGTLVAMADGQDKPVELLVPGDVVRGKDGPAVVQAVQTIGTREVLAVRSFTGESLLCTESHPFMVDGQEVRADMLETGQPLDAVHGLSGFLESAPAGQAVVHAITVDGGLYFAGGLLTHNKIVGGGDGTTSPGPLPSIS